MNRRAFTLLETVLAMVVGMLVLATALSVMLAVQRSDRILADLALEQSELTTTQTIIGRALARLRAAPNGVVREALPDTLTSDQITEIIERPFGEPIPGLAPRFILDDPNGSPRLELVCDRNITGTIRPRSSMDDLAGFASIGAGALEGYRAAIELRDREDGEGQELWWVPLPPPNMPESIRFLDHTLPEPTLLCAHIASLKWTGFMDHQRLDHIRAIESRQLPAYVELEITTTGGLYASWMFELGWTPGPEANASEAPADAPARTPAGGLG